MTSKLINIPENKLDEVLISKLSKSSSAVIIVSFVLESGLKLIIDELTKFISRDGNRLIIITSNYLKATQPKALELLLSLKDLGAEIYVFDSLEANKSFHIKGYFFKDATSGQDQYPCSYVGPDDEKHLQPQRQSNQAGRVPTADYLPG